MENAGKELGMKAEFSIEASYVMSIVILSLAIGIRYAYSLRGAAVAGYAVQEAAIDAAHMEEEWDNGMRPEEVEANASLQLGLVNCPGSITVEKNLGRSRSEYSGSGTFSVEVKVNNPEDFLRSGCLWEDD